MEVFQILGESKVRALSQRITIRVFSLFGLLFGCAASNLSVNSVPQEAEVSVVGDSGSPVFLGKTPLNVPTDQVTSQVNGSATLVIAKPGFKSEHFLVPKISLSSRVQVSAQLKEDNVSPMCAEADETLSRVVRDVAEVQNLMLQKRYDQAKSLLDGLILRHPKVSVFHDLQGNIYYLQRVTDQALKSYQRSLQLDPTSTETQRMVQKLENILGKRSVSGDVR